MPLTLIHYTCNPKFKLQVKHLGKINMEILSYRQSTLGAIFTDFSVIWKALRLHTWAIKAPMNIRTNNKNTHWNFCSSRYNQMCFCMSAFRWHITTLSYSFQVWLTTDVCFGQRETPQPNVEHATVWSLHDVDCTPICSNIWDNYDLFSMMK